MNELKIRMAVPDDAERLLDIYGYYILNTAVSYEYEVPGRTEFRDRIAKTLECYPYIVAELDGKVLGYAYAGPLNTRYAARFAVESSIYVDCEFRHAGIGRQLYSALEEILIRQNAVSMTAKVAYTEREDDPHLSRDSVSFHNSCGFIQVGKHGMCGYKFGRWYDLLIMEKQLVPRNVPMPEFMAVKDIDLSDIIN